MVKLEQSGTGELFELDKILNGINVTMTQFIHSCIAAGCDYLDNVRGVGINKAFTYVKSGQLFTELRKKGANVHYEGQFKKALAVFEHQTIFNPTLNVNQPLNDWKEKPDDELQNYCGKYPYLKHIQQ